MLNQLIEHSWVLQFKDIVTTTVLEKKHTMHFFVSLKYKV